MARKPKARISVKCDVVADFPTGEAAGTVDYQLVQHLRHLQEVVGVSAVEDFVREACREKLTNGSFSGVPPSHALQHLTQAAVMEKRMTVDESTDASGVAELLEAFEDIKPDI